MKTVTVLILLFFFSCSGKNEQVIEEKGQLVAYNFKTVDFEGLEEYLKNDTSETVVVNFWATWCAPCIKELPAFEKLNKEFESQDVSVILVSLDFPSQLEHLKSFIKKKNLQSDVVFLNDPNENEWISKVDTNWSGAIPATLMLTNNRRFFYERSFTYDELESTVRSHIN